MKPLHGYNIYFGPVTTFKCFKIDCRPGAIPASTIPTPIPAHLFDSDSSHLGYDSNSDSDSNTIFVNDSDSDSDSYSIPTAALLML